jgi:hypothetical protein
MEEIRREFPTISKVSSFFFVKPIAMASALAIASTSGATL